MKINMAQLVANHDELKAQAKTLEASLKDVGGKMMAVPQTAGFQGTAQKSILDYTKRVHQKGTADLQKSTAELVTQYGKLLESFSQNVDNSPTAIINSDVLQDLQRDLQKVQRQLSEARQQMNRALADAADEGANVSKLDDDAERQLQEESQFITKLLNDLANFNNQKVSKELEDVSERLVSVEADVKMSNSKSQGKAYFKKLDKEKQLYDQLMKEMKKHHEKVSPEAAMWLVELFLSLPGISKMQNDKDVFDNFTLFVTGMLGGGFKLSAVYDKFKRGKFAGRSHRGIVSNSKINSKDTKAFEKWLYKFEKKFNLKTYSHSQVHNDLMMTNKFHWGDHIMGDSKIGKGLGYVSDAIDWGLDFLSFKNKHGIWNSIGNATEHLAVNIGVGAASGSIGSEVGGVIGTVVGGAIDPAGGEIGGAEIGTAIGGTIGEAAGYISSGKLGSKINDFTDKHFHWFGN